jgi:sulfite reductase (NADPH) flavoprotein alpha-component
VALGAGARLAGASVVLFWASGCRHLVAGAPLVPRMATTARRAQADMLIFVASENGSTWGFAQALHDALVRAGHKVHSAPLEHFQTTRRDAPVFVLAATYGDGQAPAHARSGAGAASRAPQDGRAGRRAGLRRPPVRRFCAYAEALDQALRAARLADAAAARAHPPAIGAGVRALGRGAGVGTGRAARARARAAPAADHRAHARLARGLPRRDGSPAAILRFTWPALLGQRLLARKPPLARPGPHGAHFAAGDLLGDRAAGRRRAALLLARVQRRDGFVEICVRQMPGGLCSDAPARAAAGRERRRLRPPNPGFALPRAPAWC